MKKNHILYTLALFGVGIATINAAPSYNFKVSSGSITNGNKVTASVTVSSTASWQIKITSSGNTEGCSNKWADATGNAKNTSKTFSTTCKASSTGVISFRLEGNITDEAGNTVNLSGTKTVTVKEKAPDSKINTLSSLKVDGFELSPAFDSEVLEYSVVVPPNTTKINIAATKKDATSTISGTGEFDVTEGENKFTIDVKAQNGDLRTYTINVSVTDENPIKVNVNNEEYTILKTSRNLEIPSLYSETTCSIEEETVPCFINENTNITLVALKNSLGVTNFFVYEDNKYTRYYELVSDNLIIMPTNNSLNLKGYIEKEISINDNKVKAYQYKKVANDFYVFEGRDLEDNTIHTYLYNQKDNTYILFDNDLYNSLYKDYMFFLYVLGGAAGVILLSLIIIMIISSKNRKVRKFATVLEEKVKHKDKEIEKIKKIYYNNRHKKRNKKEVNGETSNIKINKLDDSKLNNSKIDNSNQKDDDLEEDLDEDTNYNILKD